MPTCEPAFKLIGAVEKYDRSAKKVDWGCSIACGLTFLLTFAATSAKVLQKDAVNLLPEY